MYPGDPNRLPDPLGRRRQLDMLHAELGERVDDRVDDCAERGRSPALAAPRSPSGFVVDGTSLISVVNAGSASARGIA